jgi:hypothetical protein
MLESLLVGSVGARAEARKWTAVLGRIISSTLNAHGHTTGSALATVVRAVVWYEYLIADRRYSCDVIDIGDDVLRESAPDSRLFMRVRPKHSWTAIRKAPKCWCMWIGPIRRARVSSVER